MNPRNLHITKRLDSIDAKLDTLLANEEPEPFFNAEWEWYQLRKHRAERINGYMWDQFSGLGQAKGLFRMLLDMARGRTA